MEQFTLIILSFVLFGAFIFVSYSYKPTGGTTANLTAAGEWKKCTQDAGCVEPDTSDFQNSVIAVVEAERLGDTELIDAATVIMNDKYASLCDEYTTGFVTCSCNNCPSTETEQDCIEWENLNSTSWCENNMPISEWKTWAKTASTM